MQNKTINSYNCVQSGFCLLLPTLCVCLCVYKHAEDMCRGQDTTLQDIIISYFGSRDYIWIIRLVRQVILPSEPFQWLLPLFVIDEFLLPWMFFLKQGLADIGWNRTPNPLPYFPDVCHLAQSSVPVFVVVVLNLTILLFALAAKT